MKAESVGLSSYRLDRIQHAIEKHISDSKLPGSVTLLARHGKIAHLESYGLMDRERNKPMHADALFRIYSMTKPITCVALMLLYELGHFQLLDPVEKFIPEFAELKVFESKGKSGIQVSDLARSVTMHDLLTHTSGISYHFLENGPVEQMYRDSEVASRKPLDAFIADLLKMPLAFQPGSQWRYGYSYDVIARIVEIISGMQFDVFLKESIFDPLGMKDTDFFVAEENLQRLTALYGPMDMAEPQATASKMMEDAEKIGRNRIFDPLDCPESRPHNVFRGGHGLVSTAMDFYKFCSMLLNKGAFNGTRILGTKTVELMTVNHVNNALLPFEIARKESPGYGYGLGFRVLEDLGQAAVLGSIGEFGWSGAAGTYFWIDPTEQMIGIQMTQFQPGGYYPISPDFRVASYQSIVE